MSGRSICTEAARLTRRAFLRKTLAGLAVAASAAGLYTFGPRRGRGRYAGALLGAASTVGHLLRDQARPSAPDAEASVETVIVGGGIAGLSAAWWLEKNAYRDFTLLELERNVGGNSQSGRNSISAYPWGAHYVPLPGTDARLVRMLFEELGVIRGYEGGAPIYDELYLCAEPHERLFHQGRWREGLVPSAGLSPEDRRQHDEFFAAMARYKSQRGRDGRKAFSIPVDLSSRDPALTALDRISMEDYMRRQGWTSGSLHWYVRYCCRDDYGVGHDRVSAWAGIHYFASRAGDAANADSQTVLTWPAGNGWLVERLRERLPGRVRTDSLVYAVRPAGRGATVDCLDVATGQRTRIRCRRVIFAAPRFVAARVIHGAPKRAFAGGDGLRYAPWMVANVSLLSLPGGPGAPLSWDNVSYYSESLGYVVATHQDISLYSKETVITYYRPLDALEPSAARQAAAGKTYEDWARMVADDLEGMHPGIKRHIANIDVWVWGHGMVSPGIGFIWGKERRRMQAPLGAIHFAHSDMSGISTFEEAQYHGVRAADQVLKALGLKRKAAA